MVRGQKEGREMAVKSQSKCAYCKNSAKYIAFTGERKWELLCEKHFISRAYGFGEGYGYRLSKISEERRSELLGEETPAEQTEEERFNSINKKKKGRK